MNFRAYAKINIGLRILAKRPDGYHNIETIFHQIDFYDELSFEPAETVKLTTSSPELPGDSTNLCVRAAQLVRDRTGHTEGMSIHLAKRIPIGAGLGGGSSDAATVLVALNKLWRMGMTAAELESLASNLGSDVPFFVAGGSAAGTSRGEVLEHFDLHIPYWILTATPPIHVSTAWAYSNIRPGEGTAATPLRTLVKELLVDPEKIRTRISNDFEDLVYRHYPEIRQLKERLDTSGALFTQLSGSGSSVFGFFQDKARAHSVAAELASTCTMSLTPPNFKPGPP